MFLQRRLRAIETHIGANSRPALIIAVKDNDSEAALEKAKAEYKEQHPEWQDDVSLVVWVNSQETKDALLQTIARLSER